MMVKRSDSITYNDLYVSFGNDKLTESSKLFLIFNLPSGISLREVCPGANKCLAYCYAYKAENVWKTPLQSRIRNYQRSKDGKFVEDMIELLNSSERKFVRIHESGDFYSQKYFDKMMEVVRNVDKKFAVYTQSHFLTVKNVPENIVIRQSIWEKAPLIEGVSRAYVNVSDWKDDRFKTAKICTKRNKCDTCLYCWKTKGDVVFELH